jgi:archaellum component FlaC
MSDALKDALRELREDFDRLHDDLKHQIDSIVGHDEDIEDEILIEEDGKVSVDVAELKSLFGRLDDASGDVDDAFQTFDREVERVWRRFKQALVQHSEVAS